MRQLIKFHAQMGVSISNLAFCTLSIVSSGEGRNFVR